MARDDDGIVERMDKRAAGRPLQLDDALERFGLVGRLEIDLAPVRARCGDFLLRGGPERADRLRSQLAARAQDFEVLFNDSHYLSDERVLECLLFAHDLFFQRPDECVPRWI